MKLVKIYLSGLLFLAAAIVVNTTANWLGIISWYDFLQQPLFDFASLLWLFIVYPFILGWLVSLLKKI